nr:hypothetical protein [Afifella sp. JA880]
MTVASASAWFAVTRSPKETSATLAMPSIGLVTVVHANSACACRSAASDDLMAACACSYVALALSSWAWQLFQDRVDFAFGITAPPLEACSEVV